MRGWRSKPSRRVWRHGHGGARVPREGQKRLGPHSWHGGSGKVPEHRVLDRHYCITTDITAITDITGITGVKRTLFCFSGCRRQGCGHGAPIMRGTLGAHCAHRRNRHPVIFPFTRNLPDICTALSAAAAPPVSFRERTTLCPPCWGCTEMNTFCRYRIQQHLDATGSRPYPKP